MKANTRFTLGGRSFYAFVDHQDGSVWIQDGVDFNKSFFRVSDPFYKDFTVTPINPVAEEKLEEESHTLDAQRYFGPFLNHRLQKKVGSYTRERGKPTGGPASYYDFPDTWCTWNDLADFKSKAQWKEHSYHLGNVGKAIYRWGEKTGTSKEYDAKKIVYSGLRVLLMLVGKDKTAEYIKELQNDPQFKKDEE